MTTNPFADDPTVQTQYAGGRWRATGKRYTTGDVSLINERLASEVERINSSRSLSAEAKQIGIARAYREARDRITAMRQEEADRVTSERAKLSRRLFGHEGTADAQTVIVRRDASDRAAKLTGPEEAEAALRRAEADGDAHLAQAIAKQSYANGWADVVQTWFAANPQAGETAEQLQSLPDPNDGVWRMKQAITYSVARPAELGDMPDHHVDRLADTDLDADSAA